MRTILNQARCLILTQNCESDYFTNPHIFPINWTCVVCVDNVDFYPKTPILSNAENGFVLYATSQNSCCVHKHFINSFICLFQFDEFVRSLQVDPHSPLFRLVTDGQPPLRYGYLIYWIFTDWINHWFSKRICIVGA